MEVVDEPGEINKLSTGKQISLGLLDSYIELITLPETWIGK